MWPLYLSLFLSLASANVLETSKVVSDLEEASLESQVLAEELQRLLTRLEEERGLETDEEVLRDIVTRIQEIGEATEEENYIRLTETVKQKRREEVELQASIKNLQHLREELEGINVAETINQKVREMLKYSSGESLENVENEDEDTSRQLEKVRDNVELFIELFK